MVNKRGSDLFGTKSLKKIFLVGLTIFSTSLKIVVFVDWPTKLSLPPPYIHVTWGNNDNDEFFSCDFGHVYILKYPCVRTSRSQEYLLLLHLLYYWTRRIIYPVADIEEMSEVPDPSGTRWQFLDPLERVPEVPSVSLTFSSVLQEVFFWQWWGGGRNSPL